MTSSAEPRTLYRQVYPILIVVAAGALAGRLVGVTRVDEPGLSRPESPEMAAALLVPLGSHDALAATALVAVAQDTGSRIDLDDQRGFWPAQRPQPLPTLSGNDRSRWATIRALVDNGTYAIGYRDTDPETGAYQDYGIMTENGWQTVDKVLHPAEHDHTQYFYSSKPPLFPTLVAGEYWLLKNLFGWSITDEKGWAVRTILFTVNWLPWVVYLVLLARLVERFGVTDWGRFYVLAAGCFATFFLPFLIVLNNHTVAACSALFALHPALSIWYEGKRSAWLFVAAGFFAGFTACNELPAASFAAALGLLLLWRVPRPTLLFFVPAAAVPLAGFLLTNYLAIGSLKPAYSEVGGPWYAYPGSHWETQPGEVKRGIDWASQKESRAVYAFHVLLGHHGFFSLTPIFLLAAGGMGYVLFRLGRGSEARAGPALQMVVLLTLGVTLIVVGFYVLVVSSRNYGGWTIGLRWLLWLTPFWLLSLIPAADWLSGRRWGRRLAYVVLALSVLSVHYCPWIPWRHPWLYDFMTSQGWINY